MKKLRLEILEFSYWEHFKAAKDVALILPINHPKRKLLEKIINEMIIEINILKKEIEEDENSNKG